MATAVMHGATESSTERRPKKDRSVEDIIDAARISPTPVRGALTLSFLSAALLWASFTPLDWGPLAWLALVPLIQLVRLPQPTPRMYRYTYLGGLVFSLAALQWMRLGDPWMYPAWIALAAYVAVYFPLFIGVSRVIVHRWRLPLAFAIPVVWVGLEFARAHLMSGFAWYYLGHTQHSWTKMIQISDLVGAYGVSFVVAMGNAVLAGLSPRSWLRRLGLLALDGQPLVEAAADGKRRVWSVVALLVTVGVTLAYGMARRVEGRFEPGPRVALIQGNFTSSLKHDPDAWEEMFRTHSALTGLAVPEQPDVIVWPETMFTWPLMHADPELSDDELATLSPMIPAESWTSDEVRRTLSEFAEKCRASMILGLEAFDATEAGLRRFNSAVLVEPGTGISGRYDKLHRVPFGEFIPFSEQLPWLQRVFAFSGPVGISAGEEIHFFNVNGARFAPLICFEDTVPHLVREIVAAGESQGDHVDCLVNLTNDGWFHGSSELDQHLITASFRCIETRTPMVRAVNTGISAIIDGDGLVREPEQYIDYDAMRSGDSSRSSMRDPESGRYHKQLNAALIGYVPLDARRSLYTRFGDWFAVLCAAVCCVAAISSRWLPAPEPTRAP